MMTRFACAVMLLSACLLRAQVVPPITAECATSVDGSVVLVPNPLNPPIAVAGFSGTLSSGNYFVEIAWYDAVGHVTLPGPEVQVQLSATGSLQVSPPAPGLPSTALGMQVFIGSTSGGETLQGSTSGGTTYSQSIPLVSGTVPPTVNNTVCQVIANDAGWPTGTGYNVALTDPAGNTLPGYPAQWQLLGPGNTINLSQGTPLYNGTVTYPSPILALPYGHAQQSIAGSLTLGSYSLTAGSIIAANSVSLVNPGIFTPGYQDYLYSLIGGYVSGNPQQSEQTTTSAIRGGIIAPPGATVTDTVGGDFSALNYSTGSAVAGAVYYGGCMVTGSSCWGQVDVATDLAGTSAAKIIGEEIDFGPKGSPGIVGGLLLIGGTEGSGVMPTGGASFYVEATTVTGSTPPYYGFITQNSATQSQGLFLGAKCSSGSCANQGIAFASFNGAGQLTSGITTDPASDLLLQPDSNIVKYPIMVPSILYSAAGTPLPTCNAALKGAQATVIDATSPTYMGAYTSGGAITAAVICSYNGSTYSWLTH